MKINLTYCGDDFTIYTNIILLCCTTETNMPTTGRKKKKKKLDGKTSKMEKRA